MSGSSSFGIDQVRRLVAAGNFDEAKLILESSLIENPDDPGICEHLGLVAFHQEQFDQALSFYRRAVALNPSSVETRLGLLKTANRSNDRALAAKVAAEAEAHSAVSADPRALVLMAKAYQRNRDHRRSGDLWRRVAKLKPKEAKPLIEAAEAFIRCKSYRDALECADGAIERDAISEGAKIARLRILHATKAVAEEWVSTVADLAKSNASAAMDYAPTLLRHGLYDVVADVLLQCCRQGARVDPLLLSSSSKALASAAKAAQSEGRFTSAAHLWRALLESGGEDDRPARGFKAALTSLSRRAREAAEAGDHLEATELLRAALTFDESNSRLWRQLGSAFERLEWWFEAAEAWLRAAESGPEPERAATVRRAAKFAMRLESAEDRLALLIRSRQLDADSLEVRGWTDRAAAKCLKSVLANLEAGSFDDAVRQAVLTLQWNESSPTIQPVLRKLGSRLVIEMQAAAKGFDSGRAVHLARLLLAVEPRRLPALKIVARNAYEEKRFEDAADLYRRLIEIDPGNERHYAKLGRIYRALRMHDEGIPIVTRLLELHPGHPIGRQLLSDMLHEQQLA